MFRKHQTDPKLQAIIDQAFDDLLTMKYSDEAWKKQVDKIDQLRELDRSTRPKDLDPNTVLLAATNLLGIFLIISHERAHVITTKALGFIPRLK